MITDKYNNQKECTTNHWGRGRLARDYLTTNHWGRGRLARGYLTTVPVYQRTSSFLKLYYVRARG